MEICKAEEGITREVVVQDDLERLPVKARNIARLYEAFAEEKEGDKRWYPEFECALKRHELIESVCKESDF